MIDLLYWFHFNRHFNAFVMKLSKTCDILLNSDLQWILHDISAPSVHQKRLLRTCISLHDLRSWKAVPLFRNSHYLHIIVRWSSPHAIPSTHVPVALVETLSKVPHKPMRRIWSLWCVHVHSEKENIKLSIRIRITNTPKKLVFNCFILSKFWEFGSHKAYSVKYSYFLKTFAI